MACLRWCFDFWAALSSSDSFGVRDVNASSLLRSIAAATAAADTVADTDIPAGTTIPAAQPPPLPPPTLTPVPLAGMLVMVVVAAILLTGT